jgi:hypothetical protein
MQEAVGATPPRANLWVYYGRDINVNRVGSLMAILAEQTWDTDLPPETASHALRETAHAVMRDLMEEHDVTMYDPYCWARNACWFTIHICMLILEDRLPEAANLLYTDESLPAFQLPARSFKPTLYGIAPAASEHDVNTTRQVVLNYTTFMAARVDNLYQRARVEVELSRLPDRRNGVYDGHATLVLIDAVFSTGDVIETDHPLYVQLRELVLSRPQNHYEGNTELPYLPHLHAVCRWIAYANQLGENVRIVLSVGPSRCRDATPDITGICWADLHTCGFFSPRQQLMTDAADVWDLLVLLNRQYVPS